VKKDQTDCVISAAKGALVHRGDQSRHRWYYARPLDDPLSIRKGSNFRLQLLATFKRPVLGRLGWNSYGTERAQRVANVRLSERPKLA
jgi:hypothetical protein